MALLKWEDDNCYYIIYGEIGDLYLDVKYDNIIFTTNLDGIISKKDVSFISAEYPDGMFHDPPDPESITIKLQNEELYLQPKYKPWHLRSEENPWSTLGYDMVVLADELLDYDIDPDNNEDFINIVRNQAGTIYTIAEELKKNGNVINNNDDIIKLVYENIRIVDTLKGKDILSLVNEINNSHDKIKEITGTTNNQIKTLEEKNKQLELQLKEYQEKVEKQNKKYEDEISKLTTSRQKINSELDTLVQERTTFKNSILESIKNTLAKF
ncbi:hypothetical protein Klosneuvirus_1_314 [Klosneuvirus KNV1]|uniref:Uncharacterized protein n=1 Tax=Klosneuvirus KNV1 TaxID=1977640 RepID=A0A1V0SIB8_9VIRU|nr:hypothetical protein Klosneuvirus_1_314 [Klosneuvirus KNV1]